MDTSNVVAVDHVDAPLHYLVPMADKPVAYNYEPPPGVPQRTGVYAPHTLAIGNARRLDGRLSLDEQGFLLVSHHSAVADFYDDDEVRALYYPEIERLVKDLTGADKVVVFDHTLRSGPERRGRNGVREPVRRVHNDYTVKSGPQRVRDLLEPDEAEDRLRGRFAVINVWRPINGPV